MKAVRWGVLGVANIFIRKVLPPLLTVIKGIGERRPTLPAVDQYGLEFEAFSEALRRDLPVPIPAEDAVANQKVLDALFRSESSGQWEAP